FEALELVNCGAGDDFDAAPPESVFERDRDIDVGARNDPSLICDTLYSTTEISQDRRELAARVGRPDDADPLGQSGHVAHVFVGQAELGPRDGWPPRPSAAREDSRVRP